MFGEWRCPLRCRLVIRLRWTLIQIPDSIHEKKPNQMKLAIMFDELLVVILISAVAAQSGIAVFDPTYEEATLYEGSKAEIWCNATGEEPLHYTWYSEMSTEILSDRNSSVYSQAAPSGSTLIFNVPSPDHEGLYTCSAKNIHGLASKIYKVSVRPATSEFLHHNRKHSSEENKSDEAVRLENVEVVNVTDTSVTFSLLVSGNPLAYFVTYKEREHKKEWNLQFPADEQIEISGLIPSGRYKFQFRVQSSLNESGEWSNVTEVVLLPDAPEVIFRNLGSGTLKIGWFRKSDDIRRETIDVYTLSHRSVSMMRGNYWVYNNCITNITIPACGLPYYTISGLSSTGHYEIQLAAHTKTGYGKPTKFKVYVE